MQFSILFNHEAEQTQSQQVHTIGNLSSFNKYGVKLNQTTVPLNQNEQIKY